MNADTGAILFERHAHLPLSPASTTKIATALYVLDQDIDLNRKVTVSREAMKLKPPKGKGEIAPWWHESDGTMMGIKTGEILTIDSLLHGLMLVSGNDAANVIAENVAGTIPQFVERVNEYLAGIGCKNTQYKNPHGLTDPDHFSTAYDLALMTCRALKIPKFRKIVSTLIYTNPGTNKQPQREIKLTNPMLKPGSRYYYPKAIGVKTGYTAAAKQTLVAAAEHDGRTLVAVLLACENKGERFEDAKRLFDAAFAEQKATRRLMGPENIFTKDVPGSKKMLKASLITPLTIAFFPSEEPKCKAALHWKVDQLPIRKGQKVAEVHILDEQNRFLEKGDLIALEEVKGNFFFVLKEKVVSFFR
ncbi:MAG: D-alanyl-D-alanine carboxypeptidase [Parachlamydiales bacterium]|nr:D-alanyl-D-alanine carboxypeptidase [Parachlamydiales bacterium]